MNFKRTLSKLDNQFTHEELTVAIYGTVDYTTTKNVYKSIYKLITAGLIVKVSTKTYRKIESNVTLFSLIAELETLQTKRAELIDLVSDTDTKILETKNAIQAKIDKILD